MNVSKLQCGHDFSNSTRFYCCGMSYIWLGLIFSYSELNDQLTRETEVQCLVLNLFGFVRQLKKTFVYCCQKTKKNLQILTSPDWVRLQSAMTENVLQLQIMLYEDLQGYYGESIFVRNCHFFTHLKSCFCFERTKIAETHYFCCSTSWNVQGL